MFSSIKHKLNAAILIILALAIVAELIMATVLIANTEQTIVEAVVPKTEKATLQPVTILAESEKKRIENFFSDLVSNGRGYAKDIEFLRTQFRSLFLPPEDIRHILNMFIKGALENNNKALGVYAVFEPNGLDSSDSSVMGASDIASNESGRFAVYWAYNEQGEAVEEILIEDDITDTSVDESGQATNAWYQCAIDKQSTCILEPYVDQVDDQDVLMTSIVTPIKFGNNVVGVVGIDVALNDLQQQASLFATHIANGQSRVLIASGNKFVLADSKDKANQGQPFDTVLPGSDFVEGLKAYANRYEFIRPIDLKGIATWHVYVSFPTSIIDDSVNEIVSVLEKGSNQQLSGIVILGVLLMVIGVAVSLFVSNRIVAPITHVTEALRNIASGEADLTKRIKVNTNDEAGKLADYFNQFIEQLAQLISQFADSAKRTFDASGHSIDLSKVADRDIGHQKDMIAMVSTAAEEMSQTSADVAQNAAITASATNDVTAASEAGISKLHTTSSTIDHLSLQLSEANDQIKNLAQSSDNIADVLNVIKSVAEQTNLLALNAAIEAARAGEQGRGFAVVADEVRSLAARTADSVSEIESVIASLQTNTKQVVGAIEASVDTAHTCTEQAKDTLTEFDVIIASVQHMSDMASNIATAAEQQSQVSVEISGTLQNIHSKADELAANAHEALDASKMLHDLGKNQATTLKRFKF